MRIQRGYILLVSVLVLGAAATAAIASLLFLGVLSSQNSLTVQQAYQANGYAHACVEEALQRIRDTAFTGSGSLTFTSGSCDYTVLSTGGEGRTVQSTGIVGTIKQTVSVTVDAINPQISVTTWEEVSDY